MKDNQKFKIALLVFLDVLIININYLLALLFRFEFDPSGPQFNSYLDVFVSNLIFLTVIKLAVFVVMGLYRSLWRKRFRQCGNLHRKAGGYGAAAAAGQTLCRMRRACL